MPKKYGVKEKDQVVSHIVNLVLTGKLRTGDRVHRNELAAKLGVSRIPIQEAVVQLEHDGLLSTRYHRGTFVERFDEATVFEQHELYGVLNGIVSARAAADPNPGILPRLDALMRTMRNAKDWRGFQDAAWRYRQLIADEYAGPRLGAAIRAAQTFLPRTFWATYQDIHQDLLPFYEAENAAIPSPGSGCGAGHLHGPLEGDGPRDAGRAGSTAGVHTRVGTAGDAVKDNSARVTTLR